MRKRGLLLQYAVEVIIMIVVVYFFYELLWLSIIENPESMFNIGQVQTFLLEFLFCAIFCVVSYLLNLRFFNIVNMEEFLMDK